VPNVDEILSIEMPAFARAVRAVITGDAPALRAELGDEPSLIRARSASAHRATLLHYVAANGIEPELQAPVPNADEIAAILLSAGADVDAKINAYGGADTTLTLTVSSDHPTEAGAASRVVDVLCAFGAAVNGPEGDGAPLATALYFATLECVTTLLAHGARTDNPVFATAAGRLTWLKAWFVGAQVSDQALMPAWISSDPKIAAEQALVFASMCGQTPVVRWLLDQGVDVNAEPPGSHWTATPLHTAAVQGQVAVVQLLLARGADHTLRDARYKSTPAQWLPHARGPRRALARQVATLLDPRAAQ